MLGSDKLTTSEDSFSIGQRIRVKWHHLELGGFWGHVVGFNDGGCEVLFDSGVRAVLPASELECGGTTGVAGVAVEPGRSSGARMISVIMAAAIVCSVALFAPLDRLSRPAADRPRPGPGSRVIREQAYSGKGYVVIKGVVMNEGDTATKTNLVTGMIAGRDRSSLGMRSKELGPLRAGQWKYFSIKFATDSSLVTNYEVWNLPQ